MKHNTNRHCWSSYTTIEQMIELEKKETRKKDAIIFMIGIAFMYAMVVVLMSF